MRPPTTGKASPCGSARKDRLGVVIFGRLGAVVAARGSWWARRVAVRTATRQRGAAAAQRGAARRAAAMNIAVAASAFLQARRLPVLTVSYVFQAKAAAKQVCENPGTAYNPLFLYIGHWELNSEPP